MGEGKWVTDTIIAHNFNIIQQGINKTKYNVIFVDPSVVQILKKSDKNTVKDTIENFKMDEKEYIFLPVNNHNKLGEEGGSHWSLLVYSKEYRGFFHHDPIDRANYKHAAELMCNITAVNDKFCTRLTDICSPKQYNGYDCGLYIIMYARKMADNIAKGI